MNHLRDELLEDECFEDPITLIDSEQARINAIWRETENAKLHENTSIVNLVTEDEPAQKRKFVLPVTFFDVPSNLKLLNCCCPLTIQVVDCDKFPWYYKKYKRNISTDDTIVIEDDLSDKEMNIMKTDGNIPKSAKIKSGPLSHKILQMRLDHRKQIKDIKTDAIGQKNVPQIDFKRNMGLVGLKITPLKGFDNFFNKSLNNKAKKPKIPKKLDKSNINKYILDVDTVLQNVGTTMTPIENNENNNVIVKNVPKNNNKVIIDQNFKNNNEILKKKRKRRRVNNGKHTSDEMAMIISTTNSQEKSLVKKSETILGVSPSKSSDVKDKRKTNKYLNDLLKKKIKTMNIIRTLKKLNEQHKSDLAPITRTLELKFDANVHNETDNITPQSSNDIIECGSISPVLPCKTIVCNKFTPKGNEPDPKLDLLKKKLMDDINKLNGLSNNVISENVDHTNNKVSGITLELSDEQNDKIKEADKTSLQNYLNYTNNNNTSDSEITNLINACAQQLVTPSAATGLGNESASSQDEGTNNINTMVQQKDRNLCNDFKTRNLDSGVTSISNFMSQNKSYKAAQSAGNNIHNVIIKSTRSGSVQNFGVNNLKLGRLNSEKKISKYIPPNQRAKYVTQSGLPIKTVVNNRPIETSAEIEQTNKALGFKRAIPHYHSVPSTLNPQNSYNHLTPCTNNCMTTPLKTTPLSYRMPPLANVYSKDSYVPYWNTYIPPPPPPPPLPPPPPPPPLGDMPQPHYAAQYLPKHIPIYPTMDKPNINVYNRVSLVNCQTNSNAIHTNSFNIQTETNVKLVNSKKEMLEELEKEMSFSYNQSFEGKKQKDSAVINDTSCDINEPNYQSKTILPISCTTTENFNKNSINQPALITNPNDINDAIKNKIKPAVASNFSVTTAKIKPTMIISDLSNNTKNTYSVLPINTSDKNNNENKLGNTVLGAENKINKPRIRPSSKVKKPNVDSSYFTPQTDLSCTKDVKTNGYSPPILPIPTYGSLELLSRVSGGKNILCLNYRKRGYQEESRYKQGSNLDQQRKTDHKREKMQRVNDEKAAKKISLEEYKKRIRYSSELHAEDFSVSVQNKRNRKEHVTSKSVKSLSGIVNYDQDLGYDSDSTVKL